MKASATHEARVFAKLPAGRCSGDFSAFFYPGSQKVIRDITDKMGAGMAEYVSADLAQGTADQAAYDRQGRETSCFYGSPLEVTATWSPASLGRA